MDKQTTEDKIFTIFDEIKKYLELERKFLEMPKSQIIDKRENLLKNLMKLENAMDLLRLFVKYLFFDLEATKEEKR